MNQNKDQQTFIYTYSAKENAEIEKIRKKYQAPEADTKLQQLHKLDASVYHCANAISIAVGVIGALLMGLGMSMVMTPFGDPLGIYEYPVGITAGLVGLATAVCAYPLYRAVYEHRKAKVAPQVMQLLDQLDEQNKNA